MKIGFGERSIENYICISTSLSASCKVWSSVVVLKGFRVKVLLCLTEIQNKSKGSFGIGKYSNSKSILTLKDQNLFEQQMCVVEGYKKKFPRSLGLVF